MSIIIRAQVEMEKKERERKITNMTRMEREDIPMLMLSA